MRKQSMRAVLLCAAFGQNRTGGDAPESDFRAGLNDALDGCVITKYTGSGGDVVIPAEIQGFPVREIGEGAFAECGNLVTVDIAPIKREWRGDSFRGCVKIKLVSQAALKRAGYTGGF
ncbi:MAG: leucine-rich repeat domain-containing protein [Treponema sp.]|nr:leucine-rich repeat domain-containing protein [Treponema sp.]